MTGARWEQVKQIVDGALGLEPAARPGFLDRACGTDHELRGEVESLLRHESDGFMERRPSDAHALAEVELGGRTLSHYRIESEISRGGMGIVYRARDTRLDRDVAIKALRPELAAKPDRLRRFEQEARAASALNDPSIVHVYDIGEEDGIPYIAMEYVAGTTLRERLAGREPLPLPEVLSAARQLAAGLVKAHAAGIVHRDLKPENLMLTGDGRLKVLDFGLAKLLAAPGWAGDSAETPLRTQEGMILGTARYMSPEQARGRGDVDFRSDQFAFGSILYEMLSGSAAFARDSIAQTMAAIIESEPAPIRKLNRGVPSGLAAVVSRCLQKAPERRYASTEELASALDRVGEEVEGAAQPRARAWAGLVLAAALGAAIGLEWTGPETPPPPAGTTVASLAVLPLADASRGGEDEYFADGMTGGVIESLAGIGALRVTSRHSSMHYRDTDLSLREIGRELDVDSLLLGRTSLRGETVHLSARLVDVESERALWSHSFEAPVQDVLGLQGRVARRVAEQVRVALAPDEEERLRSARPVQAETYQAYLRGLFFVNQFTPEGFEKGMRHLHEAVASDPADPLAWAGLALGYNLLGHGPNPPPDAFSRARAAAERAASLDPTLADAQLALAEVALYSAWDWTAAGRGLVRALEANPNHAEARYHYAWYLLLEGRESEAISEMERAARLDPFTPKYAGWLGYLYAELGRHDEAIQEARKSLEVSPENPIGWFSLGLAHLGRGENEQAVAAHLKAAEHENWRWPLMWTYARLGRVEEARALATDIARDPGGYDTLGLGWGHAELGDRREALDWLQRCVDQRLSVAPWMGWYPAVRSLRDEPRFQELLGRMNLTVPPDRVEEAVSRAPSARAAARAERRANRA